RIPVEYDVASEFRYREAAMAKDGLTIVISQSGETADTLAAMKYAKEQGQKILSIVNVLHSSIARNSDIVIPTLAGAEIGVASTKAFTTQLTVLLMLALNAAQNKNTISRNALQETLAAISDLPAKIEAALQESDSIKEIAEKIKSANSALYLGRGSLFPIALEGALKLKEISYIHAEGYPAGEMKHGPIALVDEHMPIVVLAPSDNLFDKTASNIQEVAARNGKVILVSDTEGYKKLSDKAADSIIVPSANKNVLPILYVVSLQILAYWCALKRGNDVDQPRNLAKSVTVE
ncbi:MAG: isomerizing glutamine--fructose-6-phosphate transaminase, partial [Alphaproteobacteria bacterium]|nr:isomerizing glutamine--fructose-6-phosphate transaminase [Alphaproteobacteria bacterium]